MLNLEKLLTESMSAHIETQREYTASLKSNIEKQHTINLQKAEIQDLRQQLDLAFEFIKTYDFAEGFLVFLTSKLDKQTIESLKHTFPDGFYDFAENVLKIKEELASNQIKPANEFFLQSIDVLELKARPRNIMDSMGIKTIGDLVKKSELDMLKEHGFGKSTLTETEIILNKLGLEFGMSDDEIDNYNPLEPRMGLVHTGHRREVLYLEKLLKKRKKRGGDTCYVERWLSHAREELEKLEN